MVQYNKGCERMDYKQLQYFLAIADEASFSKASRKLYITQQALSKAIEKLEEELQVSLFTRSNTGIELTKYGRELRTHAVSYVNAHEKIISYMHHFVEQDSHKLSIGYATGMMSQFPKDFLSSFIANHPETDIIIYSYPDDSYNRSLQNYDIDIHLCSMITTPDSLDILYEHKQRPFLLLSKDHPLAKKDIITKNDLINEHFVSLNTDNEMQKQVSSVYNDWGLHVSAYISPAEYTILYELLSTGNYVSFYATHYDDPEHILVKKPIMDMNVEYCFYIISRKNLQITNTISDLITSIKQYMEAPIV